MGVQDKGPLSLFSEGLGISNDIHDPLGSRKLLSTKNMCAWRRNHSGSFYTVMTIGATIRGFVATFTFPVYSSIGVISLPVYCAVQAYKYKNGDSEALSRIKTAAIAWIFCLIALAGAASFLALSAFRFNLFHGVIVIVGGCAISIGIHIYRALREPEDSAVTS